MCALFYRLEETGTREEETLVVTLLEGSSFIEAKPLPSQGLMPKVEEVDRASLELIRKQQRGLKAPFSYLIKREETMALLKLLAGTGCFYAEGKPLICDFFNVGKLTFEIQAIDKTAASLKAIVHCGKREFRLSEALLLIPGSPVWLKIGQFLYQLKTDCSWKRLKSLWSQEPIVIDEEWREWLSDREDLTGDVAALLNRPSSVVDPMPLLILKDRVGAFADLVMEYGTYGKVHYPARLGEQLKGVKRNLAAEQAWERDLLETDYMVKPVGTTRYYCPVDKIAKSLAFLLELGWKIVDAAGNTLVRHTSIAFNGSLQGERLIVQGGVSYGEFQADVSKLAGAFNRREQFVQLGAGVVGLLPENLDKETICTLAEEGELTASGRILNKSSLALIQDLEAVGSFQANEQLQQLMESLQKPEKEAHFSLSNFNGELRPYQQQGVNWLHALYSNGLHGLLADEMGLGKTVQVLAFLASLPSSEQPSLIVMPTSLLFNWRNELERFTPRLPHLIYHGQERDKTNEDWKGVIILTSYATLRIDLDLFKQISWHCVILDESQAIKNPQSQTAQAVFSLHSHFRLSLTGTPIENRLEELWSQFHFLIPSLLGGYSQFQARLQAIINGSRELQRLRNSIAPFLLRRKKDDVAKELPAKTEQELWIEMPQAQRAIYEDFLAGVRGNLFKKVAEDGVEKHRMEILEAILRLRQLCCHPLLALPSLGEAVSGKMEMLDEELETLVSEGRKVLVFSQFASMLRLIRRQCESRGWLSLVLDGETESREREKLVRQFQEDGKVSIFLISLKAGGVGLNLTAADSVILFDPWWNVAAENQAIDRAHRIGQEQPVLVKRYLIAESIEEKVAKLKEAKRKLSQELLEEIPSPNSVTADELFDLLA